MFYIMLSKIIPMFPNLERFTWNFSESGHGKGPPDGIGGVIKRVCDRIIANGTADISNFQEFNERVQENVKKIAVIPLTGERDFTLEKTVKNLSTVKGE